MNDENKFDWVPFYQELAKKLLPYKDDRKPLVEKVKQIFENKDVKDAKINMPTLEEGNKLVDIDPFTVFGLFNKASMKEENRKTIISAVRNVFSIAAPVPTSFDGIPTLFNKKATYYNFLPDRDDDDTEFDDLWDFFEAALKYAENTTSDNKDVLSKYFDIVIHITNNGNAKITMGLYWIAPDIFLNLDSRNEWYIYKSGKIPAEVKNTLPKPKKKIPAKEYFEITDKLKDYLQSEASDLKNFKELSYEAWAYSEEVNQKNAPSSGTESEALVETKEEGVSAQQEQEAETHAEAPEDSECRYWWLNANPKVWSLSEIAVGETQSYTLKNDNRNKRRIFQNFLDVRPGDMVIGYEATPVKQIVAICKITAGQDGEKIQFEKTENLISPIDYATFKECPELEKMEFITNPNGSLFKLTKDEYDFIMDMIRDENPKAVETNASKFEKKDFLGKVFMSEEQLKMLVTVLKNKKNIILRGAPGVGKTFAARRLAYYVMGKKDDSRIEFVQFHQNYSYEDFVMGYKPTEDGFELETGIFYNFCLKAANQPDKDFFFIIDEINRGNMSKIFGELFMLIENDYRGTKTTLAYDKKLFSVPKNLYIIGTMNTADRSLAMIDYALRRRFSFFDIKPGFDSDGFKQYQSELNNKTFNKLIGVVKDLNEAISADSSLGKGFCIGHSYFSNWKECTEEKMRAVVDYDIIPMLSEYWFDEDKTLQEWSDKLHEVFNDK